MGKNQSASNLTNIIKQDANGNISFVSGSTTLMSVSSSGAITTTGNVAGTASYATNAELFDGLDSTVFTLTSSFTAQTASFTAFTASVNSFTSSLNSFSASILSYTASQNITNGTFTTTSSFAAQTASFTAFTSSVNTFTASQNILNGTYATTGSNTFTGIQTVNSNLIVTGSITAQTLVVQTITSSVDFVTGSTRFGSILGNTHVFSGSVSITGSLSLNNVAIPTSASLASTYLQLAGGTLTGALSGTSATFSGNGAFSGVLQVAPTTGTGIIGVGDNFGGNMNAGIYRGGLGVTTSGNYLNIGGYDGVVITTGAAALGSQTVRLTIASTGAATFSSGIATLGYTASTSYAALFNGAVGIGTSTPGNPLDVLCTVSNSNAVRIKNTAGTGLNYGLEVQAGTNSVDHALQILNSSGGSLLRVTGAGNVGIGTSSPQTKLHITAASATTSATLLTIDGGDAGFSSGNDANTGYSINFDGCSYSGASNIVQRTGAQIQMLKSGSWNESDGAPGTYGNLVFKTNNGTIASPSLTERMRITSGGNVGIGTTAPLKILHIAQGGNNNGILWTDDAAGNYRNEINNSFNGSTASSNLMTFKVSNATTTGQITVLTLQGDGTIQMGNGSISWGNENQGLKLSKSGVGPKISLWASSQYLYLGYAESGGWERVYAQATSGGVYLTNGATSWTANSDERLKNINSNIENAVDKLLTLRTVNYSWKSDELNRKHLGLIAQDVKKVFPELVDKDEKDEIGTLGVKYTELIPVLVKAIQELNTKLDAANVEIEALKAK